MNGCFSSSYENVKKIAEYISKRVHCLPTVGIICGSGLGSLANGVENATIIPYSDIPGFPCTPGPHGNFIFGILGKKNVVIMQERFHMYEGFSKHEIAIPIRVMKLLGVKLLLISNAAGGLNRQLQCGDLVIIKDHISMPGLCLNNVLVGPNDERFGLRFPSVSDAYDSGLRKLARKIAEESGFINCVHEGVYAYVGGPSYESPAECNMLLKMGADVVGMSTAPEVILARHCGIKVFAVSLVTNISVLDVESNINPNHEEVLLVGQKRAQVMQSWFINLLSELPESY